jgi:hypothetical protein
VADARAGRLLFTGPPDTVGAPDAFVGGGFAVVRRRTGGIRWWDLVRNQELQLDWPGPAALSGSGTWLAVVTPKGALRVLDPRTGEEALTAPISPRGAPISVVGFAARRPELLAVDAEGWLIRWNLAEAARHATVAQGEALLTVPAGVSRLQATSAGDVAVLEYDDCIVRVDLAARTQRRIDVALTRAGSVDPERGHLLVPARGAALLELDADGTERALMRALPFGGFVCFDENGVRQRG